MTIQKVKIRDFKVIENFESEMNGSNILLIGENGVGKSSVMQFIQIALGDTSNIPPNAQGEGEVWIDKKGNEYHFQVRFKDGKPIVTVTGPGGLKDSRKSALAQIIGAIDFDVNEFVRLSDSVAGRKKQVEIYKSLLPKEIIEELDKHEGNIRQYYNDRTEVNRKAETLKGFIKESPLYGKEIDIQPVDVSDLQNKLKDATAHNQKLNDVRTRINERVAKIDNNNKRIEQLKNELEQLVNENEEQASKNKEAEAYLNQNKPIETDSLHQQINEASEINAKALQAKELKAKQKQLKELEDQAGEYTVMVDTLRQTVQDAIRDMDSVVDGLSFDEDQLLYNGVPVSTASLATSEIIHLGCKLKMAQNPEFDVLFIEDGQSLGQKRFDEIKELAKAHGWQIIMEQVQRGQDRLTVELFS